MATAMLKDAEGVIVSVRVSRRFRLRIWLAVKLLRLAAFVAGADFRVDAEDK